jgi:hypothetical protein
MMPSAILLGLAGGLIPRFHWWTSPAIGLLWSVVLSVDGDPTMSAAQIWIAGFALGTANGAVGIAVTRGVVTATDAISERFRARALTK